MAASVEWLRRPTPFLLWSCGLSLDLPAGNTLLHHSLIHAESESGRLGLWLAGHADHMPQPDISCGQGGGGGTAWRSLACCLHVCRLYRRLGGGGA